MNSLGIIGMGFVGHAQYRTWIEHVDKIRCYDIDQEKRRHELEEVVQCEVLLICVPTPMYNNGECDTSIVWDVLMDLDDDGYGGLVVLKSTVPVGFTKRMAEKTGLNIVHSPEFLTARCAVEDAHCPSSNIVGLAKNVVGEESEQVASFMRALQARFPGVPLHTLTSDESETVKLMKNSFFAIKIAAMNEYYQLCEKTGMHWESVLAAFMSDGRIAHSHTQVPGPDGATGYGGACLPKDIRNMIHCMKEAEVSSEVLRAAATWSHSEGLPTAKPVQAND